MKSTLISLFISLSFSFGIANAESCTDEQAKNAASDFLKKQLPNTDLYLSSVSQKASLFINDKELKGNYEIRYARIEKSDRSVGEIGFVEVHPGTCKLVRGYTQSAWLSE